VSELFLTCVAIYCCDEIQEFSWWIFWRLLSRRKFELSYHEIEVLEEHWPENTEGELWPKNVVTNSLGREEESTRSTIMSRGIP